MIATVGLMRVISRGEMASYIVEPCTGRSAACKFAVLAISETLARE